MSKFIKQVIDSEGRGSKQKVSWSARLGVLTLMVLTHPAARSAGLTSMATKGVLLIEAVKLLLIAVAVVVGLAYMFKGLNDAFAKSARGNDDHTWGTIATKIIAGGFLMVLSWLGMQVTETFGASSSNIGADI